MAENKTTVWKPTHPGDMPPTSNPMWTAILNAIPFTIPGGSEDASLIFSQRVYITNRIYETLNGQ